MWSQPTPLLRGTVAQGHQSPRVARWPWENSSLRPMQRPGMVGGGAAIGPASACGTALLEPQSTCSPRKMVPTSTFPEDTEHPTQHVPKNTTSLPSHSIQQSLLDPKVRVMNWMVGQRASASSHRYQKFSCVLAPIGDQHYSAAVRSASHSSQVVGLPS